jgi:hypothetical protein
MRKDLLIHTIYVFLQQRLNIRVHAIQLPGDRMLRAKLLLCQPFNPPDIREKPANLPLDVPAVLLGHDSTIHILPLTPDEITRDFDTASHDTHPLAADLLLAYKHTHS